MDTVDSVMTVKWDFPESLLDPSGIAQIQEGKTVLEDELKCCRPNYPVFNGQGAREEL